MEINIIKKSCYKKFCELNDGDIFTTKNFTRIFIKIGQVKRNNNLLNAVSLNDGWAWCVKPEDEVVIVEGKFDGTVNIQ